MKAEIVSKYYIRPRAKAADSTKLSLSKLSLSLDAEKQNFRDAE
jgi:hypothetical protein